MKKPIVCVIFLAMVIFNLSLLQVVVSNRLSTTGVVLGTLQDEIQKYQTENTILSERLLVATSLNTIASAAAQVGFSEAKAPIVLGNPIALAQKR